MSTKTFNYPFHIGTKDSYNVALTDLNNKLESLKKEVSYFDFYNITTAVTNSDEFSAQLNSLPLNQSLVINTSPFYYSGESYSLGDIVLKNHLGETYHISAQTGGVFYPQKIEGEDGVYTIHFGFSGSSPTTSTSSNIKTSADGTVTYEDSAPFSKNMTYGGFTSTTASNIYGYWGVLTHDDENDVYKYSFSEATTSDSSNNTIVIHPSIQFFLCDSNNTPLEQVFIEYSLTHNAENKQWTVSISDTICPENLYVKEK